MPDDDSVVPASSAPADDVPADTAASPNLDTGYTESGVPTLDGVREKIETRYGKALGHTELAEQTPEVRSAAELFDAREQAAAERLEAIRESMRKAESGEDS